ncbi:hypothetical protein M0811_13456 [Anaeramoeba ignava]|uniref:Uncharacterized protein n=1 Tax=Anaeramoeba ignava TaxID=1746090 RepID=A0A9Q0L5X6_ANAIG|nr:hypothetical protein M0811_13456 [Anaeramoeba ignava]
MVKALIQLLTSYHLMKNTTDSLIPIYRRIISFSLQTFFNNFKEANFLKTPNQDFIFMTKLISFTLFEDPFFFDVLEKIRSIWANIVSLNLENRSSLNFIDLILEINQNFTEKVKNLEISKPGASSYTNKKQLYDQFGVWMRWFTHNSKKIK